MVYQDRSRHRPHRGHSSTGLYYGFLVNNIINLTIDLKVTMVSLYFTTVWELYACIYTMAW